MIQIYPEILGKDCRVYGRAAYAVTEPVFESLGFGSERTREGCGMSLSAVMGRGREALVSRLAVGMTRTKLSLQ